MTAAALLVAWAGMVLSQLHIIYTFFETAPRVLEAPWWTYRAGVTVFLRLAVPILVGTLLLSVALRAG